MWEPYRSHTSVYGATITVSPVAIQMGATSNAYTQWPPICSNNRSKYNSFTLLQFIAFLTHNGTAGEDVIEVLLGWYFECLGTRNCVTDNRRRCDHLTE